MVPKWCPDVKNKVAKRKTATITRYKKSLCLQGFSQITYKKICGNTRRFWLFHDPRNQFASNRTWVRIPPAAPARHKRYTACDELFYFIERHIVCSFCCISLPKQAHFVGLRFGGKCLFQKGLFYYIRVTEMPPTIG